MPNWKKVIVSGSNAVLNQITSSGGIITSNNILPDQDNVHSLGTTDNRFLLNGGTPVTVTGSGTQNFLTRFESATTVETSSIFSSDTLTRIQHSNDGNTIFIISGSNGELLTVTDSDDQEVFRVNDDNGLAVLSVSSSGFVQASGNISASGLEINTLTLNQNLSVGTDITASSGTVSASAFIGDGSEITGVISSSYALTASHALNTSTPTLQEVTTEGNITDQGLIVSGSTTFNPKSTAGGKILLTNQAYSGNDNPVMTFQDSTGKNNVVIGHSANDGLINIHDQDSGGVLRTALSSNFSAFDPGTTGASGIYFGQTSSIASTTTNNKGYLKIYGGSYSGATAYNLQINRYNNAAGSGSIGLYGNMNSTSTAAPAIQITSRNAEKVVNLGGSSFINSNKQNYIRSY